MLVIFKKEYLCLSYGRVLEQGELVQAGIMMSPDQNAWTRASANLKYQPGARPTRSGSLSQIIAGSGAWLAVQPTIKVAKPTFSTPLRVYDAS